MDIKVCKHCGESNQSKFYKNLKTICRACRRTLNQMKWDKTYKNNPEFFGIRHRYHRLKMNAYRRGISFDLIPNEFLHWYLANDKVCHYCGQKLVTNYAHKHTFNSLTIDRRCSAIGYSINNIELCCRRCNMIKGSWFTEKDMLEIANKYLKGIPINKLDVSSFIGIGSGGLTNPCYRIEH